MRFLRRIFGRPRYEWMSVCPDSDAGYQALHEELGDGWEFGFEYVEYCPGGTRYNHIFLRREI